MSKEFQIAQLWIGGPLSYLEQLCTTSLLDAGHHVKIYTYAEIENIPEGVEVADASEIMALDHVITHERTGSPAPHADKWRYRMLAQCEDTIWADTDAYCVQPFTSETGHFFGWESARHINNGVLGLPRDSEALGRLIEFTDDEYAIPPWFSDEQKAEMEEAQEAGQPIHVGAQPWGVWGPQALTHFLHETGEHIHALPIDALFPVPFKDRRLLVQPNADLDRFITDRTLSVHFWGRRIRKRILEREGGEPPRNSPIGRLLSLHDIVPADAPLPVAKPAEEPPEVSEPFEPEEKPTNAELRRLGEESGFFEELGHEHSALFVRSGPTLIVTFENLDHVLERNEDRLPWGFDFVRSQGWSILGLMSHGWTWYRDEDVYAFFNRLRDEGFFDQFERVVFYGASMGGYAACAFSAACPGATVVSISPQATLDRELTIWETRYKTAWSRDYTSDYGYAPHMVRSAGHVFLLFDPSEPLDAMHACLFQGPNITKLKCRLMGHRIASALIQLKLLKPIISDCVSRELTREVFYRRLRARRTHRRFLRQLLDKIDAGRHPYLVALLCEHVLSTGPGPVFRQALRQANLMLKQRGITPPGERAAIARPDV